MDLPLSNFIPPRDALSISITFLFLYVIYAIASTVYDVYCGELSRFPGPKLWAASKIPKISAMVGGSESFIYTRLHEKYGPIVRVGPQDLIFASGADAWKDIYGFKKHDKPHPYKDPTFYGELCSGLC